MITPLNITISIYLLMSHYMKGVAMMQLNIILCSKQNSRQPQIVIYSPVKLVIDLFLFLERKIKYLG